MDVIKTLVKTESASSGGIDENFNVPMKAFGCYEFTFYGIGNKDIKTGIYDVWNQDKNKFVKCLIWGDARYLGTYIKVYVIPFENMTPAHIIIGGLAVVLGLFLTWEIVKTIKDMSVFSYGALSVVALFIAWKSGLIETILK